MTSRVFALGMTMALAAAAACGDSGGSVGSGLVGVDGSVPSGDGGTGAVGPTSKLITSAGGSVSSADGRLTITIPQNTFKRPTTVTIKPLVPAPAGALGPVYEVAPAFAKFEQGTSATAALAYSANDLAGGSAADLNLGLYTLGRWEQLDAVPNATKMTVSAKITSFGGIGLLSGICEACEQPACTEANCLIEGVAGKCVPYGNACSRCVPTCDTDNDGFCAGAGQGGNDCNPTDPNVNPDAPELCNGVDDNCNQHTDEGCTTCKTDAECTVGGEACLDGVCNICQTGCNPATNCGEGEGAARVPGICVAVGLGCAICAKPCDLDGDGFCITPSQFEQRVDCDDANRYVSPKAAELCGNNIDDDCNGYVDDNCSTCANDAECTGNLLACVSGACVGCANACDPAACAANGANGAPGRCASFGKGCSRCVPTCDTDGDGSCPGNGDPDDSNPNVSRDALELCGNNLDDNGNGHKDEGCTACTTDAECPLGQEACVDGACDICGTCDPAGCKFPNFAMGATPTVPGACFAFGTGCGRCVPACDLDGDGFCLTADAVHEIKGGDCDDTNPNIYTDAPELCGNAKDDDCDGIVDEDCVTCATSAMCGPAELCSSSR